MPKAAMLLPKVAESGECGVVVGTSPFIHNTPTRTTQTQNVKVNTSHTFTERAEGERGEKKKPLAAWQA